ncbi:NifB/NifX family molybdenum-iron cluster-binding protein [Aeropyrum camini]|uniref:NifB/NifX family molybdenum-iron cluster-binding protein n=1 Tax=Aeropyrum camini TaxID=229980 RepID=UPI0007872610|nr:NifB/NifX family molybdenum-iron cluster-binding protein [Aeropyrum camini]
MAGGHFAHAPLFLIYKLEKGAPKLEEVRENPLALMPDEDAGEHSHHHHGGFHGPSKYKFLRDKVLSDINLIIAGGACMTSIAFFLGEGVSLAFADPSTPAEEVLKAAVEKASEGRLPELSVYAWGRLVDPDEIE